MLQHWGKAQAAHTSTAWLWGAWLTTKNTRYSLPLAGVLDTVSLILQLQL